MDQATNELPKPIHDEKNKKWLCPICMHSNSNHYARDIIAHISNLHGPIKKKCEVCGLLFNSKWEFQWHKYDYHKPKECPICHVKFQDDKTLRQHLRNRNEKTTLCPIDETRPKLARTIPPAPVAPPEQHLALAKKNTADVPIEGVNLAYENGLADDVDGLDVNVAIGPAVIENIRTNERTLEKMEDNNHDVNLLEDEMHREDQQLIAEVDDLLAIEEQIDVDVRSLETCAYSANTFADILSKIQNMVDELSLRQYSNLQQLVTKLDKEVEKRLASRLQAGIQAWTQAFEGRKEADVDYTMDTGAASAPAVKPDGQPQIPRFIHEIRITNQTMYLHPQLPKSRFYLFQRLLSWQAIVTSLTRIQSPRDQVALDRPTSQTYRDLLTKIPDGPEVLAAAYTAIEGRMKEVKVYVDEWINLQSEKLYGSPKEDISLWIRFLNDIKKSRPIFDTTETRKEFGAVVIDYGQVQSKVALKYDSWHQEVLGKFGAMLGNEMAQFRTHVSESRSELEQQSLEAGSTADAVGLITYVRESLKGKMKALEKQVDTYKEGHRILKGQRFQFPNHWLHINDIEDEWGAFSEIVKRKDDAIQSLQEKIVAEDKAVESRTRDYLENNKPVECHMRPDEALQRLQLSEIKDSSFKEERDKAKEALEPQETFTDQFGRRERLSSALTSSPNNEDYQDIQDFDEVSEIHDLQNTRSESDSAWFSIIPEEEIKASAENELKTRVVSLEAALHELGRKYQSLQVEIAKLQGCK